MFFSALVNFFNMLLKMLGSVLNILFAFLPNSPFKNIDFTPIAKYLAYLNYVVPIAEIIVIGGTWCVAIGIYYVYQIALRWVKGQA